MKRPRTITQVALEKKRHMDELMAKAEEIMRELDPLVREKYRDDPVKLAEWEETICLDPPRRRAVRAELPKQRAKS
jgi:uncharacterized protein (DUF2236 family)